MTDVQLHTDAPAQPIRRPISPAAAAKAVIARRQRADRERDRAYKRIVDNVLAFICRAGFYQPRADVLEREASTQRAQVARYFGAPSLLLRHIARQHAVEIVDSLGLSAEARAALTPRDVRAIAQAVLAGRRLERGE